MFGKAPFERQCYLQKVIIGLLFLVYRLAQEPQLTPALLRVIPVFFQFTSMTENKVSEANNWATVSVRL